MAIKNRARYSVIWRWGVFSDRIWGSLAYLLGNWVSLVCALEIISWLSIISQSHRVIAENETPVFNIDPARHEVEALQLSM